MIRWCDNGHPPARVLSGQRCRACATRREARRLPPDARGYGADHRRARAALAQSIAPCGYCGKVIEGAFVAAHVIDGRPEHGWMRAHAACNERAKAGGGLRTGRVASPIPAPRFDRPETGSAEMVVR